MATITFYKDLPLDFTAHPVSGDVRPITNEVAIRRAVKNLILTPRGSKPFAPYYGCDISDLLFGSPSGITEYSMRDRIIEAVNLFEPRITVDQVDVEYTNNDIEITIRYTIKNIGIKDQVTTTIIRTA